MREKVDENHPGYRALLELLRTADTVWNASRVFFERWDLSPSQFNVLNLLHANPAGLSQTDLSRQLIMHRSNLTGLVDRLEKRGLVARREVAADRRPIASCSPPPAPGSCARSCPAITPRPPGSGTVCRPGAPLR